MTREVDSISLEILRMAREIVINEYTDLRAELHNKWLAEYEWAWRAYRVKTPYPSIPPYPTEVDIVTRAQILFNFVMRETQSTIVQTPVNEPTVVSTPETVVSESITEPVIEPTVEPVIEPVVEPSIDLTVENTIPPVSEKTTELTIVPPPPTPIQDSLLLKLHKKVEEMRLTWRKT